MVINRLYVLIGFCIFLALLGIILSLLYSVVAKPDVEDPQNVEDNGANFEILTSYPQE